MSIRKELRLCTCFSLNVFIFRNNIAKLEQSIKFPYLEHLDLSSNLLGLIPDGFLSNCTKLESLNLNDNHLGKTGSAY